MSEPVGERTLRRWAEALAGGEILVAEAGTGSGKTLAYLIPSVLSGRKTIVSTGTKAEEANVSGKISGKVIAWADSELGAASPIKAKPQLKA